MPFGPSCAHMREIAHACFGLLGFNPSPAFPRGLPARGPGREQAAARRAAARRAAAAGASTLRFSSRRRAAAVKSWW